MYVYTYIYMATKTISIMEKAYNALLKQKEGNESFTDVILKLVERRGKLMDSFGKWEMSEKERGRMEKELKEAWKKFGSR
jgi:predicted CopG family antitoxin